MAQETELDLGSEGMPDVQDDLSVAEGDSAAEGVPQDEGPDAATLKAELEQARRERDEARAIQAGADRQLRAWEGERQRQNQDATRRIEAANREELKRQLREDPDAAERLALQLDHDDAAEAARAEAMQMYIDRGYRALMADTRFSALSLQEKAQIDQGLRQRYMSSGGEDFNADLAHEFAAVAIAKETKADELKTLREKVAALEAAQAGSNLRTSGGPEAPMQGGGPSQVDKAETRRRYIEGDITEAEAKRLGIL